MEKKICKTCFGAGRVNGRFNESNQWIFDPCPTCEGKRIIDLKLRVCVSEVDYKNKIGVQNWNTLEYITKSSANFKCESCNHTPKKSALIHTDLFTHVIAENIENPLNTLTMCLCNACHSTQHIDVAIQKNWIDLVNAKYSQSQLVNMCRGSGPINTGLCEALDRGEIQELKKTPEEFLKEYKSGVINYDDRLKVKFRVNTFNFEI